MPFTLFHLGPMLALGIPLRKGIHPTTLLLAGVFVDMEPLLVILLNLNYPLHGYLHTFVLAIPAGLALAYIMFLLEPLFAPLYKAFLLEPKEGVGKRGYFLAGVLGAASHVLLDTPLYHDIRPFYPIAANPFYNPLLAIDVLCISLGLLGLAEYAILAAWSLHVTVKAKPKTG